MTRVLLTIIFILSALGIIFFISIPYYTHTLQENFVQLEAEENKLERRREYISNIDKLHKEFFTYEEEREKLFTSLPSDHFVPSLFLAIRRIGTITGVRIEELMSFSIGENNNVPGTRIIGFSFSVSGSYSAIKSFISRLENLSRIVEITTMEITYNEEQEIDPFKIRLSVKSYSY